MPFAATWMNLEINILSEVSQKDISYRLYVELKKNGTSEPIYKAQVRVTDVENKLVVTKWGKGRRGKLGAGIL